MRFRSKPSEVEAIQWTGVNWTEVTAHFGGVELLDFEDMFGTHDDAKQLMLYAGKDGAQEWVPVPVGHWLVHQPGDLSDVWPVDPDYFAEKYGARPRRRRDRGAVTTTSTDNGLVARLRRSEDQAEHAAADEIEQLRELVRLVHVDLASDDDWHGWWVGDPIWPDETQKHGITAEQADLIRSIVEDGES